MLGKSRNTAYNSNEAPSKVGTIIGVGAVFDGDLFAPETIRVDGTINGNCNCDQNFVLGTEGVIKGNISAQNVTISGKVDGDINARGKLELFSTGKIRGNITARSLVIDEDAYFDGKCVMTSQQQDTPARTAAKTLMETISTPEEDEKEKKDNKDNKNGKK